MHKYTNPVILKENKSPNGCNTQRKKDLGLEMFDFVKQKPLLTKREKSPCLT